MKRKKPTRRDLMLVLQQVQHLIGSAKSLHENDVNPMGFTLAQNKLSEAFDLCIEAQGFERQVTGKSRNGWNWENNK